MSVAIHTLVGAMATNNKRLLIVVRRQLAVLILFMVLALGVIAVQFYSLGGLAEDINLSGSQRMRTVLLSALAKSLHADVTGISDDPDAYRAQITEIAQIEIERYETILIGLEADPPNGQIAEAIAAWRTEWEAYRRNVEVLVSGSETTAQMDAARAATDILNAIDLRNQVNAIVGMYQAVSDRGFLTIEVLLGVIMVAVLILSAVVVVTIVRALRPIPQVQAALSSLAGNDLTCAVGTTGRYELARIVEDFNAATGSLRSAICDVRDTILEADRLNSGATEAVQESSSAVREMVASIDSVDNNLRRTEQTIGQTVELIQKSGDSARANKAIAEEQSGAAHQVSDSVETMTEILRGVGELSAQSRQVSDNLGEAASNNGKSIASAVRQIEAINANSETILQAIGGISRIAATTNLLAMNAAIEAAHAGEYGRGFAVVAEEIRDLATQSSAEAKRIGDVLKETLAAIEEGTRLNTAVSDSFSEMHAQIESTVDASKRIDDSIRSGQSEASRAEEAARSLRTASEAIGERAIQNLQNSEQLENYAQTLTDVTQEIVAAGAEQRLGGSDLLTAVERMQSLTSDSRSAFEALRERIDQFRVDDIEEI